MGLLGDSIRALYAALVVAAIIVAALVLGRDVLMPLAIAVCLTFILVPIASWLEARRVPHGMAVTGIVVALVIAIGSLSVALSSQLVSLTGDLATYRTNLVRKVRTFIDATKNEGPIKRASDALNTISKDISKEIKNVPPIVPAPVAKSVPPDDTAKTAETVMVPVDKNKSEPIFETLRSIAHPLGETALTLLFTLFMLLQRKDLHDRVVRVAGTDNLSGTTAALGEAAGRLSKFFLTQTLLNIAFGIVVGIALWIIGVPNSALWGGLTMVMRFVPYVGSFASAIPPILLAAAVDPGWGMALMALGVFLIGEPMMAYVFEPIVLGSKVGLSPFAMLLSASFWALLWGPIGLILAAPITMTLVVLGRYVNGLEFMTVLLGDEPALSPEQQFYHRLLAGDSLAASQQLDAANAEQTFVAIGDSIVLPALRLASTDFDSHRYDRDRAEKIREHAIEVSALADTSRSDAVKSKALAGGRAGYVLVIPARNELDIAAAEYTARAIEVELPTNAMNVTQSTGLTAVNQSVNLTNEPIDAIVIVTVGMNGAQYLPLIGKRAARAYPAARIVLLDFGGNRLGLVTNTSPAPLQFTKLSQIIPHLVFAREKGIEPSDAKSSTSEPGEIAAAEA